MPLTAEQAKAAAELVKKCSPSELASLGFAPPPRPPDQYSFLKTAQSLPARERLRAIQDIVSGLQYNHTPTTHFNANKNRSFARIMDTAREMLREPLPIKCVEAVFLAMYLTCGWHELERIPIGFKSTVKGQVFRHIVLAVRHIPSGKFGALGISRRRELMDKELAYESLSALLTDYRQAYGGWWHEVLKIRIGLPMEHEHAYHGPVCWRHCCVAVASRPWEELCKVFDAHAAEAQGLQLKFKNKQLPGKKHIT